MANYRKKSFRKKSREKKHQWKEQNNIPMAEIRETLPDPVPESGLKIINGKRRAVRRRRLIIACCSLCLVVGICLWSLLSPTGILEQTSSYFAAVSFGNRYPQQITGTQILDAAPVSNRYYLLTDRTLECRAQSGKAVYTISHGFSLPVMCLSQSRVLLYDQNSTGYAVYNGKKCLMASTADYAIYCGDISRNGTFALATKSQNYTSQLTVYDKQGNVLYEWYCPEEFIAGLAISDDGKSLAAATMKTSGGKYISKLYVLRFDSASPVFTREYDDELMYSLASMNHGYFQAVFEYRVETFRFKDFVETTTESEFPIHYFRADFRRFAVCSGLTSNQNENRFSLVLPKKNQSNGFEFNEKVTDYQIYKNRIFVLGENAVYELDSGGACLRYAECGFGFRKIIPVNDRECVLIGNHDITKIVLETQEEAT